MIAFKSANFAVLCLVVSACTVQPPYKTITISDFRLDGAQDKVIYDFGTKKYSGRVDSQGLPQGNGKITYANGVVIEGAFVAGSLEGERATALIPGLGRFEGTARNGTMIRATVRYENGDAYEGGLSAFLPQGTGMYTKQDGTILYGEFHDGQLHGDGYMHHPGRSESLIGRFENGLADGTVLRLNGSDNASLLEFDTGRDVTVDRTTLEAKRKVSEKHGAQLQAMEAEERKETSLINVQVDALDTEIGKKSQWLSASFLGPPCCGASLTVTTADWAPEIRAMSKEEREEYRRIERIDIERSRKERELCCSMYRAAEEKGELKGLEVEMAELRRQRETLRARLQEISVDSDRRREAEKAAQAARYAQDVAEERRRSEEARNAEAKRMLQRMKDRCKGAAENSCACRHLSKPCDPVRKTPCVCRM